MANLATFSAHNLIEHQIKSIWANMRSALTCIIQTLPMKTWVKDNEIENWHPNSGQLLKLQQNFNFDILFGQKTHKVMYQSGYKLVGY